MILWVKQLLFPEEKRSEALDGSDSAASHFSHEAELLLSRVRTNVETLSNERASFLVTLAYCLSRVAHADGRILAEEEEHIAEILSTEGVGDEQERKLLMEMIHNEQLVFGSSQSYSLTRGLGGMLNAHQKKAIMNLLFEVAVVDGRLVESEEAELRKINQQLGLDDDLFLELRISHRKFRSSDFS